MNRVPPPPQKKKNTDIHRPIDLYDSGLGKNPSVSPGQVAEINLQKCD